MAMRPIFVVTLAWCLDLAPGEPSKQDDCALFQTCADCTTPPPRLHLGSKTWGMCSWSVADGTCTNASTSGNDTSILWDDACPVDVPTAPPDFYPDWMRWMLPAIENLTLLDLSLPGSHDTLTYDLSTLLSDGEVPHFVREYEQFEGINDFIRRQAVAQGLSVTSQLDNGMRFLDVRMMYQRDVGEWYSE